MKKILRSLTLILICLSLFALLVSCGECKNHIDPDGDDICDSCGEAYTLTCDEAEHTDTDSNKRCDKCGECLMHADPDGDDICNTCGKAYTLTCDKAEHTDTDSNKKCDKCGECLMHADPNGDDICNTCGKAYTLTCDKAAHTDTDNNKKCDKCGECLMHADPDGDDICDSCGEAYTLTCEPTAHTDIDGNKKCDFCGECLMHRDPDGDDICDSCGEAYTFTCIATAHTDIDGNKKCDFCGECLMHKDPDGDDICNTCGKAYTLTCDEAEHTDTNGNDRCDECGECLNHKDENGDDRCDKCNIEYTYTCPEGEHIDINSNRACDECGFVFPCIHEDINGDDICDGCGEDYVCPHEDLDGDGFCDHCGVDMPGDGVLKPVWTSQTIKIALNKSDNKAELSSELERYVAGEGNYTKQVDKTVDRRNIKAALETKVTPYSHTENGKLVSYEYWDNIPINDWGKSIDRIRDTVTSTTIKNAPDVYSTFIYDLVGASVQGLFANLKGTTRGEGALKGMNYFEFVYDKKAYEAEYKATGEDRGFMYEWMESLTLSAHKMYILGSDYFIDLMRAAYMIPVNIEILESVVEDITGDRNNDGAYTIDDFYAQVKAGEWTYDLLMEYADAVKEDDGSSDTDKAWLGDNVVGFAMTDGDVATSGIIYTTSVVIINKDWNKTKNDYDYSYPEENQPLYDLTASIARMLAAPGIILVKEPSQYKNTPYAISGFGDTALKAIRNRFSLGHVLFGDIMMVGALEFSDYQSMGENAFGVVPVPIYHENIDEETGEPIDKYLTEIHNVGRAGAIAYNTKKFVECTAYLNFQSTNSSYVLNEYFTYELCYSATGSTQNTIDMLHYLRANVRTSFDKAMEDAMGIFDATSAPYKITYLLNESRDFNVPEIRKVYAVAYPEKAKFLNDLLNYFKAAKD